MDAIRRSLLLVAAWLALPASAQTPAALSISGVVNAPHSFTLAMHAEI